MKIIDFLSSFQALMRNVQTLFIIKNTSSNYIQKFICLFRIVSIITVCNLFKVIDIHQGQIQGGCPPPLKFEKYLFKCTPPNLKSWIHPCTCTIFYCIILYTFLRHFLKEHCHPALFAISVFRIRCSNPPSPHNNFIKIAYNISCPLFSNIFIFIFK